MTMSKQRLKSLIFILVFTVFFYGMILAITVKYDSEGMNADASIRIIPDKESTISPKIIKHHVEAPKKSNKYAMVSRGLPKNCSGRFKSYMDYRAISNRSSKQFKLQKMAHTNKQGFRILDGKYMVAMGTYYAKSVGRSFIITLSTGKKFHAVIGDIKQDRHTDRKRQYCKNNKSIIEFIVDSKKITKFSKRMGSMMEFEGYIVKIEEVVEVKKH